MRNQVELSTPERHAAKSDEIVSPGQVLSTQAQSAADVTFADGTRAQLGENSELSMYGVATALPAPKASRPSRPRLPGTTTLLRGELTLTHRPRLLRRPGPGQGWQARQGCQADRSQDPSNGGRRDSGRTHHGVASSTVRISVGPPA